MINPWLDSVVLGIHVLAAVSWVGGMIFVAGILGPYVRRTVAPMERAQIMAAVGKRFSILAWSAIFALICTGIYNAVRFLGSWAALFGTSFGHILLVKIALVAIMIALSLLHDFVLGPRQRDLARSLPPTQVSSSESAINMQALQRLRRLTVAVAQLHLALGILVILLAASLPSF
jgi:uncharacterized membrane protein